MLDARLRPMDERLGNVEKTQQELRQDCAEIKTSVKVMETALIGTELMPGHIPQTKSKLESHETRIDALESVKDKAAGVSKLIWGAIAVAGGTVLAFVLHLIEHAVTKK